MMTMMMMMAGETLRAFTARGGRHCHARILQFWEMQFFGVFEAIGHLCDGKPKNCISL